MCCLSSISQTSGGGGGGYKLVWNKGGVMNSRGKSKKLGKGPAPASSRFCGRKLKEPFNLYIWHSSHHGRCPFGAPTTKAWEGPAGSTVPIFAAPHFRGFLRSFCGKHFHVHYNGINEEARPKFCRDVGRRVSVRRSARLHGTAMYRWQVSMVPRR